MSDIRPLKKELREKYRAIRQKISTKEKQKRDESITNLLIRLPSFCKCDTILLYVSVRSEISTWNLADACIRAGKQIAVPKCSGKRHMDYYIVDSFSCLRPGMFGIPEPEPESSTLLTDFGNSLCVVPGLVFDRYGYRLGYGGGYYDSFLTGYAGEVVGLCYSDCIYDKKLPHGRFDYRFSSFLTEKGVIVCSK